MPGDFDWDDPLDGYDTSEETTEVRVTNPQLPPAARPSLPRRPQPPPNPNLVTETLDELEEELTDLSEAERRLAKAGFYRDVMTHQLLSGDHPCAIEVEQELQAWAKERLEQLLGLRAEPKVAPAQEVKLPFTEEQLDALKQLADKVISKSGQPAPPPAQPAQPKVVPVQPPKPTGISPVPTKPSAPTRRAAPVPGPRNGAQQPQQPTRGRGRPRKDGTGKNDPTTGEMYDGVPVKVMPDGTKYVDAMNGRRYKLEPREVVHKETGERRMAYMPVELSVKQEPAPGQKPYPSEAEVEQLAAQEAHKNTSAANAMTAVVNVGGVPQKITGNALIQAAMNTPEKESYIPEPPPRR